MLNKQLTDKNIVITGATGGIGKVLALKLAERGARLLLVGRDAERLQDLRYQCQCANHAHIHKVIVADLTTSEGLTHFRDLCADEQKIDILINAVGVNDLSLLDAQDVKKIVNIVHTNLTVPILVCKTLLPQLKKQGSAIILNIGSTLGSIGFPGYTSYCASKFGLRGFTEALRRELFDTKIKVHYLSPRSVKTTMNSAAATAMNAALKNATDDPEVVASAAIDQMQAANGYDQFIGWPEKLFVKINHVFPAIVTQAISKQLATIRQFALRTNP